MHEQRVKQLGYLLLVGHLQSAVEGDPGLGQNSIMSRVRAGGNSPDPLQMHWPDFDDPAILLGLEYSIAAAARHFGHIEQLCPVDHVIIWAEESANRGTNCESHSGRRLAGSASDADARGLDLETHGPLVFPESCCTLWLGKVWRGQLAARIGLSLRILRWSWAR